MIKYCSPLFSHLQNGNDSHRWICSIFLIYCGIVCLPAERRKRAQREKSESNFKEYSSLAQSLGMNRENRVNITRIRNKNHGWIMDHRLETKDAPSHASKWEREWREIRTSILRVVSDCFGAGELREMENFPLAIVPVLKLKLTCKSLAFLSERHNTEWGPRRAHTQLDYSSGDALRRSHLIDSNLFRLSCSSWSNTTATPNS